MKEKDEKLDLEFDLDLDELDGCPSVSPIVQLADESIVNAISSIITIPLTEEEEYKQVIERLKEKCEEEYICLPTEDGLHPFIKNLKETTGEEFIKWLYYVYPVAKEMGFKEEDCNDLEYRKKTFSSIWKSSDYFKFSSSKIFETRK
jgi:hypothetical protein